MSSAAAVMKMRTMGLGLGMRRPISTTSGSSTLRVMRGMQRGFVLAHHQTHQPPLGKDINNQSHISRRTISSSSPRRLGSIGLEELERLGKEPEERSGQYRELSIADCLRWKPESEEDNEVVVKGYVRSVRGMKAYRFVSLGDGSSLAPLQAVVAVDTNQAEGCDHYLPCNISEPCPACLGYQACSIKY